MIQRCFLIRFVMRNDKHLVVAMFSPGSQHQHEHFISSLLYLACRANVFSPSLRPRMPPGCSLNSGVGC